MLSEFEGVSTGEEVEEQLAPTQEGAEPQQPESAGGLIRAEELPRATEVLAELFPEEAFEETPATGDAPPVEEASENSRLQAEEPPPKLKGRGMLSWLFRFKNSKKELGMEQISGELCRSDFPRVESDLAAESEANSEVAADATAALTVVVEEIEAPEKRTSDEQFPSATDAPAEVSSAQQELIEPPLKVIPAATVESEPQSPLEARGEAPLEVEKHPAASQSCLTEELPHSEGSIKDAPAESAASTQSAELPAGAVEETPANAENVAEHTEPSASGSQSAEEPPAPLVHTEEPRQATYRDWAIDDKLASHREWVESHGRAGHRADLSGSELEAADLISVNLRLADLHDTNLRAADMLLADLRDACLVRADLEESCLVGANLEGANLEGATLETAMGLVPRQLAGANLRDALLAPQLMEFEAVGKFARNARLAYRYFTTMTAASLISWLLIGKTSDVQLVSDSAVLPFLHSHTAASAFPTAESYLIIPVALFVCYLVFLFHLQQLWDAVQQLPAIFPDGHELGEGQPSIIVGLLRTHFRWTNPEPSATGLVERTLSLLLAYGLVPITLLLFWARYLTRQEIHGTLLQAALTAAATGIAIYASTKVGRPQERWELEGKRSHWIAARIRAINPLRAAGVLGGTLLFLSAGIIVGVPHDRARAPQYSLASVRRWAPSIFASLGYDPYPDLTEKSLSVRPSSWNVGDNQVQSVDGARLNGAKLRYAQGYGVFLANAHLLHSDLQGAFLSQADLRNADLGQSNLRFAVMDQARMRGVNLDRSNLSSADLRRADLRGANLSHCKLDDAILADARLDGASLYGSRLDGATLNRANLEKADMREAMLNHAHMDHADLQGTYLWSAVLTGADLGGAQFGGAILIDANLQGANLGGAQLGTAVLNNTVLAGASLEGADLRGALGLTAAQVCSAKSRRGAMMDDALATEVQAQCGGLQ
jgi:uncharacterized protein YjbI with pentapeptide repeats